MTTTTRTDVTAQSPGAAPPRHRATTTQGCIALTSVLAGAIHLAVAPGHFEEWWLYGTFFVVIGVFQLVYATPVLRRPSPLVALTGIVVNLGVALIWVVSRTTGLPVMPPEEGGALGAGHLAGGDPGVEAVGTADLVATGAELLVVCLLVTLLPLPVRRVTVNLMLVTGVGLWSMRLSGVLG